MSRILVWDSPTRILHWLFAGTLTGALVLGFGVDDEHPLFAYHMLLGLAAGFILVLRLVLGIVGSRHARFSAWAWSPRTLFAYLKDVATGRGERYVSHNPGSTWVTVIMFAAVTILVVTGLRGATKAAEEVHEVLAVVLACAIGAHLLGLAWHTLRHRENISRSMIDGHKEGPPAAGLRLPYHAAGVVAALAGIAGIVSLFRGYDPATHRVRLPLAGIELQLGDEHGSPEHHGERRERHHHE